MTVVEQTLPLRNRACGAFQEGSLERRDCRAHIGLQFRDWVGCGFATRLAFLGTLLRFSHDGS
ncbi:hypothetical protein AO954_34100 [Pseudomonas aeruginosa]|nr:hypothetical protein AO954_34100 [Pseudomonas aeruginosa]